MCFDFSQPISTYELITLAISIIWPIVLAFGKLVYDKFIKKPKFDFFPSGLITLCYNRAGSYFSLSGVYEAKHKDVTVQNITAIVERESDKAVLNLKWSTFSSTKVRIEAGRIEREAEIAHPFKVEPDSLFPISVEFENANENVSEKNYLILKPVHEAISAMIAQQHYYPAQIAMQLEVLPDAKYAKQVINDQFFWRAGKYCLTVITKCNNGTIIVEKKYVITVSKSESDRIRNNIDCLLQEPMSQYYGYTLPITTIKKEFEEAKEVSQQ